MNKIYVFSGLGVDKRVFMNIDFTGLTVEFIDWIPPLKDESLKNYAKRISEKITSENPILMGLSFGGMVAVEISKIIKTKKVILIASAKNKNELSKSYRIARILKMNKLVPNSILKISNFITNWLFGIESESERKLLKTIMKETDNQFLTWAINEILNWKNEENPENVIHIHGSKDRLIPIKNVKATFIIENTGHFMTINRAKEIETIIKNACK
ncbi:MAG TPA: alpha/beta hydrolase [Edaphocola sp.]|nr:alpha/beta hydrolase [Edaphocola sp.]